MEQGKDGFKAGHPGSAPSRLLALVLSLIFPVCFLICTIGYTNIYPVSTLNSVSFSKECEDVEL